MLLSIALSVCGHLSIRRSSPLQVGFGFLFCFVLHKVAPRSETKNTLVLDNILEM